MISGKHPRRKMQSVKYERLFNIWEKYYIRPIPDGLLDHKSFCSHVIFRWKLIFFFGKNVLDLHIKIIQIIWNIKKTQSVSAWQSIAISLMQWSRSLAETPMRLTAVYILSAQCSSVLKVFKASVSLTTPWILFGKLAHTSIMNSTPAKNLFNLNTYDREKVHRLHSF